jgi:hypothetical protein
MLARRIVVEDQNREALIYLKLTSDFGLNAYDCFAPFYVGSHWLQQN